MEEVASLSQAGGPAANPFDSKSSSAAVRDRRLLCRNNGREIKKGQERS